MSWLQASIGRRGGAQSSDYGALTSLGYSF
jgi:hypothetical protein